MTALETGAEWRNWVGNRTFTPAFRAVARTEEEVAAAVRAAGARGLGVRVAGAGHSFTPVVQTDGLLLDIAAMAGVRSVDPDRRRAVVGAATEIRGFYEP